MFNMTSFYFLKIQGQTAHGKKCEKGGNKIGANMNFRKRI